mgnify:CR=1 FL=1
MLFVLRMLLMGVHFILAGLLGLLLGLCRPFNPDNSRLCARLYSLPALCLLRLELPCLQLLCLQRRQLLHPLFLLRLLSLDLLVGFTGLVSFGHAAFFGVAGQRIICHREANKNFFHAPVLKPETYVVVFC